MFWKHCNNLYILNPTKDEREQIKGYYLTKRYRRIFYIVDLMNDTSLFINDIKNPCFIEAECNRYEIPILYFILMRPNYSPKCITKAYKEELKQTITKCNIPKYKIETIKEFRFRLYGTYVRIASVPNTSIADFIYVPNVNLFMDDSPLIRIAGIENDSIVDGPGFRFTIFTQGCNHHCKGCHNPETWDYRRGRFITFNEIISKITKNPMLQGITFSGGDPFMQANTCYELIQDIKYTREDLDICIYTGYTIQELLEIINYCGDETLLKHKALAYKNLLSSTNYLVDGQFDQSQKSLNAKFRGSKNQKMYKISVVDNNFMYEEIYPVEEG